MFSKPLNSILIAFIVCALSFALIGCVEESTINDINSNKVDTVSTLKEPQNSKDGQSSLETDSGFDSENNSAFPDSSGKVEGSSQKTEVIIEPESSSKTETSSKAESSSKEEISSGSSNNKRPSTESSGTTDFTGNLWDSNGDGYYDIKIH